MWCCSRGAKILFNSVIGGPEIPAAVDDDDSDSESSRDHNIVTNSSSKNTSVNNKTSADSVVLDLGYVGREVVIVKNGLRICGSGGGLGSAPLVQTKSYFEIKFQQEGLWGIGVATRQCQLDTGPLGKDIESWILRNTGELFHNNMCIGKLQQILQEGDIIGITYDHIELNFYINGVKGNVAFSNIRGTVYPGLFVDEGAVLDAIFDGFTYPIPAGFDRIIREKSIL